MSREGYLRSGRRASAAPHLQAGPEGARNAPRRILRKSVPSRPWKAKLCRMDLVIGDIHGCWEELSDLLQAAGPGPQDRIIALGDIVDRGPDTRRVAEFFRATPNARSIQGNHERKHLRAAKGEVTPSLSQLITREELGPDYPALLELVRGFPTYLRLEQAILVHGSFEPGVPLEQQRETVICGTLGGQRHLERTYDRPWYELYEGPPIVVGHRDYLGNGQPFVWRDRVWGLDTHVYAGGALSALVLPGFRLISVKARKDHWKEIRERWHARHGPPGSGEA